MIFSKFPLFLLIISAITMCAAYGSTAPQDWFCNGPSTLTCASDDAVKAPTSPVQRITFKPNTSLTDAYWCEAGIETGIPDRTNLVEFYLNAPSSKQVMVKLTDSNGRDGYYYLSIGDGWARIRLRMEAPDMTDKGPLQNIKRVAFLFNNSWYKPGDEITLLIAGPDFLESKPLPFLNPNWMPSVIPPPVKGYQIETCIWNVWSAASGWGIGDAEFNGFDQTPGFEVAKDIITNLFREYRDVGIDMPYVNGEKGKFLCDYVKSLGGTPNAEGSDAPSPEWCKERGAFAVNVHGDAYSSSDMSHCHDMTNPEVLKFSQERILESAKAGAKTWRTVDYIWPYYGGPIWGYSDAAKKRWRENLSEIDVGVEIIEGGTRRFVHFWEYFESYHGFRFKPSDMGLKSWDEYQPPKAGASSAPADMNNDTAFLLLFHYEWLKFINEAVRPGTAYGLLAQPICNPEANANGTDYYWLLKCANTKGFGAEWWGPASIIIGNYYNGRYFGNTAANNGKELVLWGESAAAGGSPFWGKKGKPHYWDNMANYMITYSQSGSVDFKAKHDEYWGSRWSRFTNPDNREYQSYTAFKSAWSGFLQCRNDKAMKPKTDLMLLTMRAVSRDGQPFEAGADTNVGSLARDVYALNYIADGAAFPLDDAFKLGDYKTIIYTPDAPPSGFAARIGKWVASSKGQTLITQSSVPTRFSTPARDASTALQSGGQEKHFGFEKISEGTTVKGIIGTDNPVFAKALKDFVGKELTFKQPICEASGGKALVMLGDKPLVSERPLGKGRVIYIHFYPGEPSSRTSNGRIESLETQPGAAEFEQAVMDAILQYAGHRPTAVTPVNSYAFRFDCTKGRKAYITYKSNARTDLDWGGETFNVFQAQNPDVKAIGRFYAGKPNVEYRVTDMITGAETTTTSDADGYVTVDLSGWNMRGFYLTTDQYRKK
ncbi:MAG: hypothetical protein ACYC0V_03720 [Armatimonadota bacterium]